MQRVFDIENEEDMKLLWSILPDLATTIKKTEKDWKEFRAKVNKNI